MAIHIIPPFFQLNFKHYYIFPEGADVSEN